MVFDLLQAGGAFYRFKGCNKRLCSETFMGSNLRCARRDKFHEFIFGTWINVGRDKSGGFGIPWNDLGLSSSKNQSREV